MADNGLLHAQHGAFRWQVEHRDDHGRAKTESMSEHLRYEIEAASALAISAGVDGRSALRDLPPLTKDWWIGNALVEAYLVHLRVLDEFFYGDFIAARKARERPRVVRLHPDAVAALDFVRDAQAWLDQRPQRDLSTERLFDRIDRSLAHLNWRRTVGGWQPEHQPGGKEQTWSLWQPWDSLRPTLEVFLDHVNEQRLCEDFIPRVRTALRGESVIDL